jgi:hypothetical protein
MIDEQWSGKDAEGSVSVLPYDVGPTRACCSQQCHEKYQPYPKAPDYEAGMHLQRSVTEQITLIGKMLKDKLSLIINSETLV